MRRGTCCCCRRLARSEWFDPLAIHKNAFLLVLLGVTPSLCLGRLVTVIIECLNQLQLHLRMPMTSQEEDMDNARIKFFT